eukprot:3719492-Prymnesium_polylepis.1
MANALRTNTLVLYSQVATAPLTPLTPRRAYGWFRVLLVCGPHSTEHTYSTWRPRAQPSR